MDDKQLRIAKELVSQVWNIDVFGRDVVNVLYNESVVALINNNEPHVTTEVVKIMDANSILVDSETTRALVRGFGAAGFGAQAVVVQKRRKFTDKPSKNNRRISDCIHEEIPMQATLQNNHYKHVI